MKCHYEVLDISRDADDSEIKSAYRKLALKWHPDKNPENQDNAKEQFQLIQQAYDVLSDRQERAWYDNHREQILRGGSDHPNVDILDVFQYFSSSCFKGYGDDENGFYSVYRKVFETIATEDIECLDSDVELDDIPTFGNSESDYEEVVKPFYAYWMSYSTKNSYVWLDSHSINDVRERKIAKLIEKENKKIRTKAKKERNDEVRNLVLFVRKRDKRVQAYAKLMEQKTLENRKKQEEIRLQKILERKEEINRAKDKEQEWTKFENFASELEEIEKNITAQFGEDSFDSDTDEEELEAVCNLYCIACKKFFNTTRSFTNHELSKKHKENVEKLKLSMLEEEEEFQSMITEEESISVSDEELLLNSEEQNVKRKRKKNKAKNKNHVDLMPKDLEEESTLKSEETNLNQVLDNDSISDSETKDVTNNKSKKNRKSKKKKVLQTIETEILNSDSQHVSDFDLGLSKKQRKKNKKMEIIVNKKFENVETEDLAEDETKEDELYNFTANTTEEDTSSQINIKKISNKETNKSKQKSKQETASVNGASSSNCCAVCRSNFASKNKLFEHLKKTGHSVPKSEEKVYTATKKNKKKCL